MTQPDVVSGVKKRKGQIWKAAFEAPQIGGIDSNLHQNLAVLLPVLVATLGLVLALHRTMSASLTTRAENQARDVAAVLAQDGLGSVERGASDAASITAHSATRADNRVIVMCSP